MDNAKKINLVIKAARNLVGSPYERGAYAKKYATKQSAFDCSSLVQYVYKKVGVDLPRSSILQAAEGFEVKRAKNMKPGDLIFFESSRGHYWHSLFDNKKFYIGHVAMYVGNGKVIDAQEERGDVAELPLSEIIKKKFYKIATIKRVIGAPHPVFNVPAYSQFLDVKNKDWQHRACGIVSLKMVMDFWGKKTDRKYPTIEALIEEGVNKKAVTKNWDWIHKGLVDIAKAHGFKGESFDWAGNSSRDAFLLLKTKLNNPVIASIHKNLNFGDTGHLIVIKGLKNGNIYYNDPDSKKRREIPRIAPIDAFLLGWKKRIIVINT